MSSRLVLSYTSFVAKARTSTANVIGLVRLGGQFTTYSLIAMGGRKMQTQAIGFQRATGLFGKHDIKAKKQEQHAEENGFRLLLP